MADTTALTPTTKENGRDSQSPAHDPPLGPDQGPVDETSPESGKGSAGEAGLGEGAEMERLMKHPLQNVWALWYFKNDKRNNWADNLRVITTVQTVEDFWALYNYVMPASRLSVGCDYSLFKDGIEPMWEDQLNKQGGRWLLNLERNRRGLDLDHYWQETLLCMIGESFDELSDEVCGAVVNVRAKGDKLSLWTRDASNADATRKIGLTFKHRLGINQILEFQSHVDTQLKTGSVAKHCYTV